MNKLNTGFLSLLLMFFLLFMYVPVNADEQSYTQARPEIQSVKNTNPNLPTTQGEQKGSVGFILSRLFDGNGKISNWFLSVLGNRSNNAVLRWSGNNGGQLVQGSIFDNGTNVGIGTAPNAYKLNVGGDINFTGDLRKNGVLLDLAGKFQDGATSGEIYYTGGNVGIGTNNPNYTLDIAGTLNATNLRGNGSQITNINGDSIADGSIDASEIAANSIGNSELATNSVNSGNIVDGSVTGTDIANNTIGNSDLANNSVNSSNIVDGSITSGDIANNTITETDISDSFVARNSLILDIKDVRTIPASGGSSSFSPNPNETDSNSMSTYFTTDGPSPSWGSILSMKGWGNNYGAWQLLGPSSTSVDNELYYRTGVGTSWNSWNKIFHSGNDGIGSGIDSDSLDGIDSTGFIRVNTSGDQIQDGTIDSTEIQNNTLTASDLAANSIGNSELATNSVNSGNIVDGSVTGTDIANNTITETDISDSFVARNSQQLDGVNSSGFLRTNYLNGRSISNGQSADSVGVGAYYLSSSASDKPTGINDSSLFSLSYSNLWSTQMAGDWRTNQWYVRGQSNGTWSSWDRILKAGGSGDDIADNTIDSSEIQNNTLTANDLATNSVGNSELAGNAVNSGNIINGSILNVDINGGAAISGSKIVPNFGNQNIATTGTTKLSQTTHIGKWHYVLDYANTTTPTNGYKIRTNLPYSNGMQMPLVKIQGYIYGNASPIDINISWYVYNGNFYNAGATSSGKYAPNIQLANEGGKVVIFLQGGQYYSRFNIQAYENMGTNDSMFEGWSVVDEAVTGTNVANVSYENTFGNVVINGALTVPNGINGNQIQDGTIDSTEIQNNSLTANDLAANSVGNSELATNAVNSGNIIDGSVTSLDIANNTITETDISDSFIARNSNLLDGINSTSFIRSDTTTNVSADTEWQDSQEVRLGNSSDMRLFHNGSNSYFRNYTGNLEFRSLSHGGLIYFQGEDSAGANKNILRMDPGGEVQMYYAGNEKLNTRADGIQVTGTVIASEPTSANHLTTKNYVDTLVSAGVSWKSPTPAGSTPSATHGACNSSSEGWATYSISDDIVYLCNASAWVSIGSTASIPYASTSTAGKVQLSGDIGGTWNNMVINTNAITSGKILNNTITESDISDSFIARNSDLIDGINGASLLRSDTNDTFNGYLSIASTNKRSAGIYGVYDSTRVGHIWSMGTAYRVADDGSNFGNLYGLAYKHTNNPTGGSLAGGHQMVWTQNGGPTSAMGTNIWTSGQFIGNGAGITNINGDSIQDGSIDSSEIQNNTITGADILNETITNADIDDGTVRTNEIANNTITETDISDSFVARNSTLLDGIDSSQFIRSDTNDDVVGNHNFWGTDTSGNYANAPIEVREVGVVTTAQSSKAYAPAITWHWGGRTQGQLALESDSIFRFRDGSSHATLKSVEAANFIGNGASLTNISGDSITDNTIDSSEIQNNSLTYNDIADGTVRNQELANNAVNSAKISDGSVTTNDIANNTITETDISDSFISRSSLKLEQSTRNWLGDLNATPRSMFGKGLSVGFVDSSQNAPIAYGTLLNLPSYTSGQDGSAGQFIFPYSAGYTQNGNPMFRVGGYNNTGWSAWKTMMDKSWSDSLYIAKNSSGDQIQDNTIDSSEIQNNTLTNADIADGTVRGTEITNNTITESDISDSYIARNSNLLDGFNSSQNNVANTVAVRNSSGDINARLFRSEYDSTNSSINFIMTQVDTASNNYIRPSTPAQFRASVTDSSYINIGSSGDQIQDGTIDGSEIQNNTLTASDLAANSVGNSELNNSASFTIGGLVVNGNITGSAFLYSSDKRLKKNITEYIDGFTVLDAVNPVRYDWIENEKGSDVGVIAQDVKKVFPEAVVERQNGYLAVDYSKLIVPTIQVVKSQGDEIYLLKKEIKLLQEEIEKIKNQ